MDLDFIERFDFRVADYSNNERKLQEYLKTNLVPLLDKAKNVMLVQRKVRMLGPHRSHVNIHSLTVSLKAYPSNHTDSDVH